MKRECKVEKNENSFKDNDEKIPSNSANFKSIIKLVKSGGKTWCLKNVSVSNDYCVEKLRQEPNFYTREGDIKYIFNTNKPIIFLVCKKA